MSFFFKKKRSFARTLIVASSLFMTIVVILLSLFVSRQYTATLQQQNEEATISSFSYSMSQIESMLNNIRTTALTLVQDSDIHDYLTESYSSDLDRVELFRSTMQTILTTSSPGLNGIVFVDSHGHASGNLGDWVFFDEINPSLHSIVDSISDGIIPSFHIAGSYQQTKLIDSVPEKYTSFFRNNLTILSVQSFSYPRSRETIYILLSIDETTVMNLIHPLGDRSSTVMLLKDDGSYVAGMGVSHVGEHYSFASSINQDADSGSALIELEGSKYQMIFCRSQSGNWLLTKLIPLSVYSAQSTQLMMKAIGTSLIIWAVFCVVYALWVRSFTRPFNEIAKKIDALRHSQWNVRMDSEAATIEFDLIYKQFNEMAESISRLRRREWENNNEKMKLELRSLQAQINPHFIYNSIAAIRWLATMHGAKRVSDMLVELAESIRPVFREWSLTWPLEEELQFIGHYMKLMHLRHEVSFALENLLPPDGKAIMIPRFTLQPLLENACEHGMPPGGKLDVMLRIEQTDNIITLTVEDNGNGIAPGNLEHIQAMLESSSREEYHAERRRGIGLVNVHRRLQLIYGPACGISIESELGKGTCVAMHILASVPTPYMNGDDLSKSSV